MPRIVVLNATEAGHVVELSGEKPVTIGRGKSCTLVLDDPSVSRLHAIVHAGADGRWEIVDRGSSNGVQVNGVAMHEKTLHANDAIQIGAYRLRFEDPDDKSITSYGTIKLPQKVAAALGQNLPANANSAPQAKAYSSSFTPAQPVSTVAVHAGADGAHANEHEKRLLAFLERVKDSFTKLNDLPKVTLRSLEFAFELDGVERGFVMMLKENAAAPPDFSKGQYDFEPAAIRYRRPPVGAESRILPQLTMSRSVIRQVLQLGLPLLISDGLADPRFSATKSVANAGIQSAMCAPLGMGKGLKGLLYVDNLSRKGMFTVEDLNAFAVLAVQTGLAIDRIRSHA